MTKSQVRCKYCNRLLMRLEWGKGEIKCGRCSRIVTFDVTTQKIQEFMQRLEDRTKQVAKV